MVISTGTQRKSAGRKAGSVKTVRRAIEILDLLADPGGQMGVIELAARLEASQSTIHRIISTLVAGGYVTQSPHTGKYELGLRALTLGGTVLNQLEIRKQAMPVLGRLAAETQCNANLAVLQGGEVLYVGRVDGPKSGRMYTPLGRRAPVHATGLGKAVLAFLPETEAAAILERNRPLQQCTPHTIVDPARLAADLEQTRLRGYAVDIEEFIQGVRCVAVPIRGRDGAVVAALSVSASVFQLRQEDMARIGALLQDAAYEISGCLGYIP